MVLLTVVYSRAQREGNRKPGLLHAHGAAYGEMLDKRWLKASLAVDGFLHMQMLGQSHLLTLSQKDDMYSEAEVEKERSGIKKEVAQRN